MMLGMSIHSRAQSEELGAAFCVLRMRVILGREAQHLRERDKLDVGFLSALGQLFLGYVLRGVFTSIFSKCRVNFYVLVHWSPRQPAE